MRAYASLRRRGDFARVQRRGQRRAGTAFVALTLAAHDRSRVGITVAKTVGNAVVRNRIRRRVKAILDRSSFGSPPHRDVVLIARPGAAGLDFDALSAEIGRLIG